MKLPEMKKIRFNYTILAFLLPFLGMCIMMMSRGFIPFGKLSMLYSDMYHQYYPFFVAFRKALRSGDSLLYNWSIGMGIDQVGLVAYYLASPLNLVSALLPEHMLLGYFSMLSPIKLGFAGLFFAIFLKRLFGKNDFSIAAFGSLYALCAWALGYQWNIMWVDTFALLPLVALGTVALLRDKKFLLYTLSLFFSVLINYYIGFFTCIFVALVFFCYQICYWKGLRRFLEDLGRIALYSALAIGMTAVLTVPAFAALKTTQSSVNKFPEGFKLNIAKEATLKGLLDAMRQVAGNMNGTLEPTFKEGLPNLFCGVGTTLLAFLFLTCRQVRLREKLCSVALLLFFNVSFVIRQLDYIWHGFHFTNMIPYRFSFLYSFVLLYMAYRAWLLRNRIRPWQIAVAVIPAVGIILCVKEPESWVYWLYNCAFLLLNAILLLYPLLFKRPGKKAPLSKRREFLADRNSQRRLCTWIMLILLTAEAGLNLTNFGIAFPATTVTDYPRGTIYTESMIRYMEEREEDNLFYRAETTHSQTLNDGALLGYNGISAFTSSANVRVTEFMRVLGYGAKNTYNRYCFEESSPVANLFLNLKYMLERQDRVEENNLFTDLHQYGKVHLLENNAYLPLGFLANNELLNVDFKAAGNNPLAFQNELFSAATGLSGDVWHLMGGTSLSISGSDATVQPQTQTGYCSYTTDATKGGTVTYRYVADRTGLVCVSLNLPKKNKFSFWKNGKELYSETYSLPQTLSVAEVTPGDVIEVKITCKSNEKGNITLHTGILDEVKLRAGRQILADGSLELTYFKNTRVEGTVTSRNSGVLYTSIPQNGNWRATVDGEPAQIVLIGDCMIGLLLPAGTHNVVFTYRNAAFALGWKLALACAAVFGWLYWTTYQPLRKKGKYEV